VLKTAYSYINNKLSGLHGSIHCFNWFYVTTILNQCNIYCKQKITHVFYIQFVVYIAIWPAAFKIPLQYMNFLISNLVHETINTIFFSFRPLYSYSIDCNKTHWTSVSLQKQNTITGQCLLYQYTTFHNTTAIYLINLLNSVYDVTK